MKRLQSIPLRVALPILLLTCAAIAGVISWKLNTRLLAGEIESQFLDEAKLRITGLQATLEYLFRTGDANGVSLEVSGMATRNDIIAAFVLDGQDRVLAATKWAAIGNAADAIGIDLPEEFKGQHTAQIIQVRNSNHGSIALSRDRRIAVAYYPLLVDVDAHALRSSRNGLLMIVFDTRIAEARAFSAARREVLDNALVFGGLAAFAWAFIHFSLTRRVAGLVATTRRLASGDLTARTGIEGSDELAQVGKAFDLMASRIAEDILRQKQVEEELRVSENRFRNVFNLQFQFIAILSSKGRVLDINDLPLVAGGVTREEVTGQFFWETVWWRGLPAMRAAWPGRLEVAACAERPVLDEVEFNIASGEVRVASMAIIAVKNASGNLESYIVQGNDITDRKRAEVELVRIHNALMDASREAGRAEVATSVLHNVGNVLNSVNTSLSVATSKVGRFKAGGLSRIAALLNEHTENLPAFFTEHPQGARLPAFLTQLAAHFAAEQQSVLQELDSLRGNVEHINEIVAMQQSYAGSGGIIEELPLADVIEDALRMNAAAFNRHGTEVVREMDPALPPIPVDRNKLLLILVNLLRNAKYACDESGAAEKRITVQTCTAEHGRARIIVQDNGIGIAPENLTRIFAHGFTTRKNGHGFGLHSSALAATEMGGSLHVRSEGRGQGATFTIELPLTPANS